MAQPARHLHVVGPLGEPVMRAPRGFAGRFGLTGVVLALVCCVVAAWTAVTVGLLAWVLN
jgi:type IV secretory pathway TrbD component